VGDVLVDDPEALFVGGEMKESRSWPRLERGRAVSIGLLRSGFVGRFGQGLS
jgi:hypothetical protein